MEIIVLSITNYKEKDAIILGLSENGVHSFLVKGLLNPKCPNIILATPLVIADIELSEGNYKYPVIKSSKLLCSPYQINDSLTQMGVLSALAEASKNLLQDEEKVILFSLLKNAIYAIKSNKVNAFQVLLIYLAFILSHAGFEMNVSSCIYCGSKKDMINFSFEEGGFICKNCANNDSSFIFTTSQMKLIHNIFVIKDFINLPSFDEKDALVVLKQLGIFIENGLGIRLNSLSLFYN